MARYYAGIGSRQTPTAVLELMEQAARRLAGIGYVLRSGGAPGADTAFERGAGSQSEIYLPWRRFGGHNSPLCTVDQAALELASQFHPKWAYLSDGGRKLHARNCYQVLGRDLNDPVKFVLCWHDNTGGTMQAVRIATAYNIPVFNLRELEIWNRVIGWVNHSTTG